MIGIEADTMHLAGVFLAMGAGALSFLSPCVLLLFPAYMSYITVISVKELQSEPYSTIRTQLLSHSLIFLFAVSFVRISLGAGASFLGQWILNLLLRDSGLLLQRIAGVFIIVMVPFVAGWI